VSAIREAFRDGPAFVPYLAVGDPDPESSREYVDALVRGGADVVELGLPFSEPIAEGPTIQGAVARALDAGMTPDLYFGFVESLEVDVPLVCMTYYNLVYQYGDCDGPEPFVERAAEAGIDGLIVPDLPVDESDPLRSACETHGLDLVFIVAPTTTDRRLERIREVVSGYVYVQARMGTTGARTDVSDRTAESLARVENWDVPAAVGFGISAAEHARAVVASGADGVIVGSALVDIVAEGVAEDLPSATVADRLESKARELTRGTHEGARIRGGTTEPEPN
jgi:tryptophan synthase alpha chain